MMQKKIYQFALFVSACGFVACSSAPKETTEAPAPTNAVAATDGPSFEDNVSDVIPEKEKPKVVVSSSQYDGLNEAIKSQNDERIYTNATQILSHSSTDLRALNAMAMYNYKKGRFEVARYLLAKAIASHPRSSELYSNLGIVQLAQNERREATKSFRQALELNRADAVASANLGALYVQEKDFNKAVVVLETAYKRGLRDARVANNYGVALMATGKYDRAEEVFKAGLKDQEGNRDLLLNYAILLVDHLSKNQEGLDVLNRLKFVASGSESRTRINALENKAKAGVK